MNRKERRRTWRLSRYNLEQTRAEVERLTSVGYCQHCLKLFQHNDRTTIGRDSKYRLIIVGECCSGTLIGKAALGQYSEFRLARQLSPMDHARKKISHFDEEWFDANSDRRHRVRAPISPEFTMGKFTPNAAVIVRKIEKGQHEGLFFSSELGLRQLDFEVFLHAIFDVGVRAKGGELDVQKVLWLADQYESGSIQRSWRSGYVA